MRVSRLTGVLAGILIALLASGSVRLAHMTMAHAPGVDACASACAHGPAGSSSTHHEAPDTPAAPTPSDCGTCALLAVLLPDGLPVVVEPFFPAPTDAPVPVVDDQVRSVTAPMPVQARGPPASITPA